MNFCWIWMTVFMGFGRKHGASLRCIVSWRWSAERSRKWSLWRMKWWISGNRRVLTTDWCCVGPFIFSECPGVQCAKTQRRLVQRGLLSDHFASSSRFIPHVQGNHYFSRTKWLFRAFQALKISQNDHKTAIRGSVGESQELLAEVAALGWGGSRSRDLESQDPRPPGQESSTSGSWIKFMFFARKPHSHGFANCFMIFLFVKKHIVVSDVTVIQKLGQLIENPWSLLFFRSGWMTRRKRYLRRNWSWRRLSVFTVFHRNARLWWRPIG